MKPKKRKRKLITNIHCHCGCVWTAVFRSGVLARKTNCPRCLITIFCRSGRPVAGRKCAGCNRPRDNYQEPCPYCRHK